MIGARLDAVDKLQPGSGQLTAGVAASLAQQTIGGVLGYQHRISEPVSVFVDAFGGLRRGVPDVGAMAGLRVVW